MVPLLRFLADGQFHSSTEIKENLGLSPHELSEAVDRLTMSGLEIASDRQAGCRLITPFSALNAAQIERCLGSRAAAFTLEVVDQTGSTNEDLLQRARQGAPHGLVRVAEIQTAGRGRRQRKWFSAPGGTLTFSLLWNFANGADALSGLPLAVGVSLARSLEAVGLQGVALKWPNDILWRQRKLGGILIETTAPASIGVSAVIGIGLNLQLTAAVVERIDQPAADLESAGLRIGRNELLACLLSDLSDVIGEFSRGGFAGFRAPWQRLHAYQDKMVTVEMSNGEQLTGKATGVDKHGALRVMSAGGERVIHSGEVSLRLAEKMKQ